MAAGGIVMRRERPPLIAVVRLRKRDEWVLPKGKLDEGETPRAAARREVLEETGHDVTVHEYLGTLVHEAGGRSKVVHYWRMEADGTQVRKLMRDVRAVDWLPLDAAIARLSRSYERSFLEQVGPLAVGVLSRASKTKAQAPADEAGFIAQSDTTPDLAEGEASIVAPVMDGGRDRMSFVQKVRLWLGRAA
jgi:8-oxo-dGTP diphosphatase